MNKDYAWTANVTYNLYTQVTMPYKIVYLRVIDYWSDIPTLESCAIACLTGFKRLIQEQLDMKCQFFLYNATSLNCHAGNLDFLQDEFQSNYDQLVNIFIQTEVLEEISNGEDFTQETYQSSWSPYIYLQAVNAGVSPLQCGALCIFDTGPCNIAITNTLNGACYLGDWYVNTTEFSQFAIEGFVSHRKPQLGVIIGGLSQANDKLGTSDVIDEFKRSCENPAIPNLPFPLYDHAGLYSESDQEIIICGGIQSNPLQSDCLKLKLDSDVPQWKTIFSKLTAVSRFQLMKVGGKFYSIGGLRSANPISYIFESPQIGVTWTSKRDIANRIDSHCSVLHENEIWIIGGITSNGVSLKQTTIYNPATDSFRTPGLNGNLNVARIRSACGVIKDPKTNHDWVLAIGGLDEVTNTPLDSIEYFDIQEDLQWKILNTQVPFHKTNVTLPLGGSSTGGMIKFGLSRYMLFLGLTAHNGASPSNLAWWDREIGQFHQIIRTSMQSGRNGGAVVQIPLHTRWTCLPMGSEWIKMVEQNTDNFFQSFKLTGYPNTPNTIISNLETLDDYKSCNGFYHLRLVWPELGYFNEWRQKSSFIKPGPVLEYKAVAVRYPKYFQGLFHVSDTAQSDGHSSDTYSMGDSRNLGQYAVGRYSNGPNGGMPGPVGNEGTMDKAIVVNKLILYVKKDC